MKGKPLLKCNDCGGEMRIIDSRVLDTDKTGKTYRKRRYQCMSCKCKIETLELLRGMHAERLRDYVSKMEVSQRNV